jgi:hypothetical protein
VRLFSDTRAHACGPDPDLETGAKALAEFWPGNQVHLWLDKSLTPTEHLPDMPPSDGSSPKAVDR